MTLSCYISVFLAPSSSTVIPAGAESRAGGAPSVTADCSPPQGLVGQLVFVVPLVTQWLLTDNFTHSL